MDASRRFSPVLHGVLLVAFRDCIELVGIDSCVYLPSRILLARTSKDHEETDASVPPEPSFQPPNAGQEPRPNRHHLLTLALGIGANTAIFTVDYATILAPLPYPQPDQLVMVWSKIKTFHNSVAAGDFTDWKRQATAFQDLNAWSGSRFNIAHKGSAGANREDSQPLAGSR